MNEDNQQKMGTKGANEIPVAHYFRPDKNPVVLIFILTLGALGVYHWAEANNHQYYLKLCDELGCHQSFVWDHCMGDDNEYPTIAEAEVANKALNEYADIQFFSIAAIVLSLIMQAIATIVYLARFRMRALSRVAIAALALGLAGTYLSWSYTLGDDHLFSYKERLRTRC